MQTESDEISNYLADRKREAVRIDPQTAEVTWWYAETLDPYGVDNLPLELQQVGREYFARQPGSEIWVWFGDLPDDTCEKLWERHKHELAFPAGFESCSPDVVRRNNERSALRTYRVALAEGSWDALREVQMDCSLKAAPSKTERESCFALSPERTLSYTPVSRPPD
jgi:hypothetical protein